MILFGHQTGNPNSHHAALAHYERDRLAAFVVPWFPEATTLTALKLVPPLRPMAERLSRRRFEPLAGAKFVQSRPGEMMRLLRRTVGATDNKLCYEVNDWLMETMSREVARAGVTAVHSPEDASQLQFETAKKRGKACIYDMPIGYYPWWQEKQDRLARDYAEWIPAGGSQGSLYARPEQKIKEMELADLVLVACSFVEKTIRDFLPDKKIAIAPYGVDAEFWSPGGGQHDANGKRHTADGKPVRFIYAGQSSIRKGTPVLLDAWEKAGLRDAELTLVGSWQLAVGSLKSLPDGVRFIGPVGPEGLRELYRKSDVFVFPSFFEGFGLVVLEAMACGLPVIASDRSAGPDVLDESCGRVIEAGNLEQLIETLRWFGANRDLLPQMKKAARSKTEMFTWKNYREAVSHAVAPFA